MPLAALAQEAPDALVKRVTRAKGVLLTPDMPDAINTPTGEFTFGMLLQVAKLYRSQARARWASATERATLDGIPVGRTAFGYRQRTDRRIEIDPDTAPIVLELFERRAAGAGWNTLTDWLAEQTGKRQTISGVRELIRNKLYKTGLLTYGHVVSEWNAGAIVDEALWTTAQRSAKHDPRRSRSDGFYLLSGLARCGECGLALNPNRAGVRRDGTERLRYKCRNRACASPRPEIRAEIVERYVTLQTFASEHELATRATAPDRYEIYTATMQKRLPKFKLPLAPDDRDTLLDLQVAFTRAYDLGGFGGLIDYRCPPPPDVPLTDDNQGDVVGADEIGDRTQLARRSPHLDRPERHRDPPVRVADRDADAHVTEVQPEDPSLGHHTADSSACTRIGIDAIASGT
jgi:hypothetical protein